MSLTEKNAHIPTAEIEQDILDTEREIVEMEREAEHLEATPQHLSYDYRWNQMRASARRCGIAERKEFVAKLKEVLLERGAASKA